jgi:hypothetical protein
MSGTGIAKQNDIESLMRDLVRCSTALKRELYRYDLTAATTLEGIDGPTVRVHQCKVCNKMAAGEEAQIKHRAGCELAKLQEAQRRLREAWPELFAAPARQEAKPKAA